MSLVLVNGVQYSWGSVKMLINSQPVVGITRIEYKTTQRKENIYGVGRQPIGRGYGNFEYSGSIELYLEEWKAICNGSPNGDPLQAGAFDITVQYAEAGTAVIPFTDTLNNCEFLENPLTSSQGDTSIRVTIPILIAGITRFVP